MKKESKPGAMEKAEQAYARLLAGFMERLACVSRTSLVIQISILSSNLYTYLEPKDFSNYHRTRNGLTVLL